MGYKELFSKLWVDYSMLNPSVKKIHDLLENRSEKIVNDHVAFRTFDIEGIELETLSGIFKSIGYKEKGSYVFEEKKLKAKHYEHIKDAFAPKVFISELITSEFSHFVQETAGDIAQKVISKQLRGEELIYGLNMWLPISYEVYKKLQSESEYAAWFYVFGFRANHFTISVNHLEHINNIENLNEILKNEGFNLNASGGEIKGGEEVFLKQSSIMADKTDIEFVEGVKEVPCCYYEFAERFKKENGEFFNGFIAKSADKIFESTNSR